MEPVEWIIGLLLVFYGLNDNEQELPVVAEVVQEQSIVSEEPVFERGRFYKTVDGYFISNLTPVPQNLDECDRLPVLTADLTAPRSDGDQIQVTEVNIVCER